MATGTVQHPPTTHTTEVPGTTVTPRIDMRPDGLHLHERGKQLVESIRSSPRSANPFLITERAEEKQITLSSRNLQLSDFGLMKTLGTGESGLAFYPRLQPANSATLF